MLEGYNVEVKLLALTGLVQSLHINPEVKNMIPSEELIEYAGRLCWDSTDKLGKQADRIQEWLHSGHESVIEHASATFLIKASRVFTHELVRHRIASYSQRSQRYVDESHAKHILPSEIAGQENEDAKRIFEGAMRDSWNAYKNLIKLGLKKEIARYVLPNACETQIIMTMNFRELRHFIKLRTSERALPEMRAVANEVKRIMEAVAPQVFHE